MTRTVDWKEVWHGMPPDMKNLMHFIRKVPKLVVKGTSRQDELEAMSNWKAATAEHKVQVEKRCQKYLNNAAWLVRRGKLKATTYEKVVYYIGTRYPEMYKAAVKTEEDSLRARKLVKSCKAYQDTIQSLPVKKKTQEDDEEFRVNRKEVVITYKQFLLLSEQLAKHEAVLYPRSPNTKLGLVIPDEPWVSKLDTWCKGKA